ncbi:unnamed protein product [Rhodiola kirilowii]
MDRTSHGRAPKSLALEIPQFYTDLFMRRSFLLSSRLSFLLLCDDFDKADVIPMRHLQEFRLQSVDGVETSQKLDFQELFKEGDLVDVAGDTIGKGFQGGIKRHNFKRGQMTHGSKSHRALGSIGAGTTPGRVYKGKKMPGRMGGTKTKIRKLPIVKIDNELRVVMIKGALPGDEEAWRF